MHTIDDNALSTPYTRLLESRDRNYLQSEAEDLTEGEVRVVKLTPGQLRFLSDRTGNPLCELLGVPLPDGCRRAAMGPEQLDYLAVLLRGDEHPAAKGLSLILDLDDRVVAGQGISEIASHDDPLVNTVAITAIQAQPDPAATGPAASTTRPATSAGGPAASASR
ncbi:hypothetical protein ACFQ61_08590 [Streptomyces sp. NPDC056500]|uniref:hypothetical protein n=1 Tax=Streptomyces sp. NPDC056500 TaxID=3345840 RepID=UPI00367FF119